MPKTFSAYKGTARCSRYGNKTPHGGSLVPRIENHTRITPATLGFQGAILQRRGESGKSFGRPPAVRSGQPLRGHEGVLSCGRKRESTPERTHVLVFTWTDIRTCSHMSGCTNTNILARPLVSKSESKHPHTHDLPASFHGFMQTIMSSPVHAPLLSRLNTAGNTIKYCLRGRYSASCSDPALQLRPARTDILENVGEGRPETNGA